jgi:hypothetical protein
MNPLAEKNFLSTQNALYNFFFKYAFAERNFIKYPKMHFSI